MPAVLEPAAVVVAGARHMDPVSSAVAEQVVTPQDQLALALGWQRPAAVPFA